MMKCSFQYSVRTCTQRAQSSGVKECQLALTGRTTDIYINMKIPPFDSLVWSSLRIALIMSTHDEMYLMRVRNDVNQKLRHTKSS